MDGLRLQHMDEAGIDMGHLRARLNTEIAGILRLPEVRDVLGRAGMEASASSADDLAQLVRKDHPRWGEVIRRNGITAE